MNKSSISVATILFIIGSIMINITTAADQYNDPSTLPTAPTLAPAPSPIGFCDAKCGYRCREAGKPVKCLYYCKMCCNKCHCVPSGTFGNKDECPCYRDWYSPNGRPKCP